MTKVLLATATAGAMFKDVLPEVEAVMVVGWKQITSTMLSTSPVSSCPKIALTH